MLLLLIAARGCTPVASATEPNANLELSVIPDAVIVFGTVLSSRVVWPHDAGHPRPAYALITIDIAEVLSGETTKTVKAMATGCVARDPETGKVGWWTGGRYPTVLPGDTGLFVLRRLKTEWVGVLPTKESDLGVEQFFPVEDISGSGHPFENGVFVKRQLSMNLSYPPDGNPETDPRPYYLIQKTVVDSITVDTLRAKVREAYPVKDSHK